MDIEDEYNRDYSFEPEFITRKDSLEMHRSRLERTRKHEKIFKKKSQSLRVKMEKPSCSIEHLALSVTQNLIEAEVDAFVTVKSLFCWLTRPSPWNIFFTWVKNFSLILILSQTMRHSTRQNVNLLINIRACFPPQHWQRKSFHDRSQVNFSKPWTSIVCRGN